MRDRAGHIGDWSDELNVRRDATAPSLTAAPINVAQLRASEQLTVTASDALSGVAACRLELRHDAGDWRTLHATLGADGACAAATGKLKRGFYEARATATDRAGNTTHYALPGEIGSMFTVPDERDVPRLSLTGLGRTGKPLPVQHGESGGRLIVPVGRPAWVTGGVTASDGSPVVGVQVAVTETLEGRTRVVVRRTNQEGRVRHRLRYVTAGARVSFVYAGSEARKPAAAVSYDIATSARSTIMLDDVAGHPERLEFSGRIAGRQDLGGIRVRVQTRDTGAKWRTIKTRTADDYGKWRMQAAPRRRDRWVRVLLDAPRKSIYADGRSATLALPSSDRATRP